MDAKTKILQALNIIRPALQEHGGDVEFVDFDEETDTVKVKLIGTCQGCPLANITLKERIEKLLQKEVPAVKEVIQA